MKSAANAFDERKLAEARAKIEARAKKRHAREQAEHEAKLAARQAKAEASGKKPRGKPPEPPVEGPRPNDQINLTDEDSRQNAYALKEMADEGFDENGEIVVPDCVRLALAPLVRQIDALDEAIEAIDRELEASARTDETARRLMTIPGIGPVTAMALLATIQDFAAFSSGREFAAFLGLTPRVHSTGGKPRLGRITKMGDRYLRKASGRGRLLRARRPQRA